MYENCSNINKDSVSKIKSVKHKKIKYDLFLIFFSIKLCEYICVCVLSRNEITQDIHAVS